MTFNHHTIAKHKVLYYRRNKYEKDQSALIRYYPDRECFARRYASNADLYVMELEAYVPHEIIEDYTYSEVFRQMLSLCSQTFRPDHFDSYFGGLFHWLELGFMEWLLCHQNELKRQLTWEQVCQLQCNWMGWRVCGIPDMALKDMWNFGNDQQLQAMKNKFAK